MKLKLKEGNWKFPKLRMSRDHFSYFLADCNIIELGVRKEAPDDYCKTALIHELNHWAHYHFLSSGELDNVHKSRRFSSNFNHYEYHMLLTEQIAWWGTEFFHSWRSLIDTGKL